MRIVGITVSTEASSEFDQAMRGGERVHFDGLGWWRPLKRSSASNGAAVWLLERDTSPPD